jgi:hypothetical protein
MIGVSEEAAVAPLNRLPADAQERGTLRAGRVHLDIGFVRAGRTERRPSGIDQRRRRRRAPGAGILERDLRFDGPAFGAETEPGAREKGGGVRDVRAKRRGWGRELHRAAADVHGIAPVLTARSNLEDRRQLKIADRDRLFCRWGRLREGSARHREECRKKDVSTTHEPAR